MIKTQRRRKHPLATPPSVVTLDAALLRSFPDIAHVQWRCDTIMLEKMIIRVLFYFNLDGVFIKCMCGCRMIGCKSYNDSKTGARRFGSEAGDASKIDANPM